MSAQPLPTSPAAATPRPQSPPSAAEFPNTGHRYMTYAQAAAKEKTGGGNSDRKGKSPLRPNIPRRPVNPPKEGRCVRCLEQGHVARECRDLIKCQLCRQGGHRQASCRLQQNQKTDAAGTGFFACLVGDLSGADASWAHILDGIQATCPNLTTPNCHRLVSGEIFIGGLSKRNWQRLHGQSARLPVGGAIRWRRPRPTDAAFAPLKVVKRVEVRGVPFGLRKWHHMEQLIRQAGALRKFVCNGLQSGDPNCICLDVEMEADTAVPRKILVTEGTGAGTEILQAVLPPPSPPPPPPPPPSSSSNALPALGIQLGKHGGASGKVARRQTEASDAIYQ